MKRIFAAALALLLLLGLAPAAFAEEAAPVTIASVSDFRRFAAACEQESYSAGRVFELTADLDLTNADFSPVPYFAGIFHGNGHLITGVSVTGEGSRLGLFRRVGAGAEIHDLRARGTVTPGGTQMNIGGLVGENAGLLSGCSFEGTVGGIENVGGVVGLNTGTGRVSACKFSGAVTAEHQAGGIAGRNEGLVSTCTNNGAINTVAVTPAGEPRFDLSAVQEDDFLNLANIGGVAGENLGVLSGCTNNGAVGYKYNAFNVGGVAGKSSGFVSSCLNNAAVTGRRDVGGVVGQLIPYAAWDFSGNKLDALAGAVGGMQSLLGVISEDAMNMSGSMADELSLLNAYTNDALEALREILAQLELNDLSLAESFGIDPETGEFYFGMADLGFADTSALTEALFNMQAEVMNITQLAASDVTVMADDLRRVSEQMGAVFSALYNTMANLGGVTGETYDLSLSEAYTRDVGAIAGSRNTGAVEAENHAGGVVGTVAFEIEFDMEDRLNASDFLLSNARHYLFAAVRSCESFGAVTVKEEGAGCIAGVMDIGAAVNCVGLGEARSLNGDCVGGIVGSSKGSVSGCWSRAALSGGKYLGGIAGHGTDIADSRSWTHIEKGREYQGAVAGWAEGQVRDNLYVPGAPAGVDGVSLTGQTKPISSEALLALEGAPKDFDSITVTFVLPTKRTRRVQIPFGGRIDSVPEVPNKDGAFWKWDEFDAEHIYYSRRVEGKYYAPGSSLSTGEDVPRFLVEGLFYEGQTLTATDFTPPLPAEEVLGAATLYVNDYEGALTVRMQAPEEGTVYRLGADGTLEKLSASRDGSYLVFELENGGSVVCARRSGPQAEQIPAAVWTAGGAVLVIALVLLAAGHRKKSKAKETEDTQKTEDTRKTEAET